MSIQTPTYTAAPSLEVVTAAAPFAGAALAISVLAWIIAAPSPAPVGACARADRVSHAHVIAAQAELATAERAARFARGSAYAGAKVPPAAGSDDARRAQAAEARAIEARRALMVLCG